MNLYIFFSMALVTTVLKFSDSLPRRKIAPLWGDDLAGLCLSYNCAKLVNTMRTENGGLTVQCGSCLYDDSARAPDNLCIPERFQSGGRLKLPDNRWLPLAAGYDVLTGHARLKKNEHRQLESGYIISQADTSTGNLDLSGCVDVDENVEILQTTFILPVSKGAGGLIQLEVNGGLSHIVQGKKRYYKASKPNNKWRLKKNSGLFSGTSLKLPLSESHKHNPSEFFDMRVKCLSGSCELENTIVCKLMACIGISNIQLQTEDMTEQLRQADIDAKAIKEHEKRKQSQPQQQAQVQNQQQAQPQNQQQAQPQNQQQAQPTISPTSGVQAASAQSVQDEVMSSITQKILQNSASSVASATSVVSAPGVASQTEALGYKLGEPVVGRATSVAPVAPMNVYQNTYPPGFMQQQPAPYQMPIQKHQNNMQQPMYQPMYRQ